MPLPLSKNSGGRNWLPKPPSFTGDPQTSFLDLDIEAQRPANERQTTSLCFARPLDQGGHLSYSPAGSSETLDKEAPYDRRLAQEVGDLNEAESGGVSIDDILLSIPPSQFDVAVRDLSIATPSFRAYIPTPIPIPIPQFVTDLLHPKKTNPSTENDSCAGVVDNLIIRKVNATVNSGEVMAIIGGSGSGKTTLLHAIASRLGDLSTANGHVSITPSLSASRQDRAHRKEGRGYSNNINEVVGFVRQNDYLLPHLTGAAYHLGACFVAHPV